MATFHLIEPYKDYSGKTCSHSEIINCLGHKGVRRDKQWTTRLCKPRDLSVKPLSVSEINARERFAAVRAEVQTTLGNPTKYDQAFTAFNAAGGTKAYKSFASYLWQIKGAAYDEAQDA